MGWRKLLLGSALAISFAFLSEQAAFAIPTNCSSSSSLYGTCTGAQTNTDTVDVWARTTTPGRTVVQPGNSSPAVVRRTGVRTTAPIVSPWRYVFCMGLLKVDNVCKPAAPAVPAPVTPVEVVYDPIDLADLASFSPQTISLSSQPAGWGVVALPVNFIASSSTHVVSGGLFGQATEVRFTPHTFEWSFGDGTATTTSQGGSRWEQLGVADFSTTSTSHVFDHAGTFTASVTVRYGVEYRIGSGGWSSVSGVLSRDASTSLVLVLSADTVLTKGDCITARDARSCP
ncbi:hypothetical protein M2119_001483 [Aurantimicrobium minutum]|nr:hypothetical protein [Aurantimicrobium minutum]